MNTAECTVPGLLDDRQVAAAGARTIEQERRERVVDVGLRRGVGSGLPVWLRVEGEEAARPALVLRLQQVVARCAGSRRRT